MGINIPINKYTLTLAADLATGIYTGAQLGTGGVATPLPAMSTIGLSAYIGVDMPDEFNLIQNRPSWANKAITGGLFGIVLNSIGMGIGYLSVR